MPHIHDLYDFVVSVFIVRDNKVFLVYHKQYDEWLPIGGHIELDEVPDETLRREIREECGLKVRILASAPKVGHRGVRPLLRPSYMDAHRIRGRHWHIAFIYFGVSASGRPRLHRREHREYRWVGEKELNSPKLALTRSIRFYCREALKQAALAAVIGCAFVTAAFADIQYAKVIETSGSTRVYRPSEPPLGLSAPFFLKKGQRIVTNEKSTVDLGFNEEVTGLARLGERSRLGVMNEKTFLFFLGHGHILLLREDARDKRPLPITVVTPQLRVEVEQGGCAIEVSKLGTRVKVFGDRVKVSRPKHAKVRKDAREVEEGFQIFAGPAGSEKGWRVSRLMHEDYSPWQSWVKKAYERKDDWEAEQ